MKKLELIVTAVSTLLGFAFLAFWNVNRVIAIVGMVVCTFLALVVFIIFGYRYTKKENKRLLSLIEAREVSCITIHCLSAREKLQKFGTKTAVDLSLYAKTIDPQCVLRVKALTSTAAEDELFSKSLLGSLTLSLSELSGLHGVTLILPDELYGTLNEFCKECFGENEILTYAEKL